LKVFSILITDDLITALEYANQTWKIKNNLQHKTLVDVWGSVEEYSYPLWYYLGMEEPSQNTIHLMSLALPFFIALLTLWNKKCKRRVETGNAESKKER
jgi:hypothetical protein